MRRPTDVQPKWPGRGREEEVSVLAELLHLDQGVDDDLLRRRRTHEACIVHACMHVPLVAGHLADGVHQAR